jgi:hypothetical protein
MLTNLLKPYGLLFLTEEEIDSILLIFPLMNGPTRIIIGWLSDLYGFKRIYYVMLFFTVILFKLNKIIYYYILL